MNRPFLPFLRLAMCALALMLSALMPARAGLVTGTWDPAFGPALPGLNWSVHVEMLVPNNDCTNLSGPQPIAGDCAGITIQLMSLRLYNDGYANNNWDDFTIAGPYFSDGNMASSNYATWTVCDPSISSPANDPRCNSTYNGPTYFSLTSVRIEAGQVVGFTSPVLAAFSSQVGPDSWPTSAQFEDFELNFTNAGPELFCTTCPGGPIQASNDELNQFLVTYTSNDTSTPKFTDSEGNALGARLDGSGDYLGRSLSIDGQLLPEPSVLLLIGVAIAGLGLQRRSRRA